MKNLIEGNYVEGIIKDLSFYHPDYIKIAGYKVGDKFGGYLRLVNRADEAGGKYYEVSEKIGGLFGLRLEDLKL